MNQFSKIKKLKIPSEDRIFTMDPTRFALVSLLVKGRILLHKLQARVHNSILSDFWHKTKTPKNGGLCLTSSESAIYANSTL